MGPKCLISILKSLFFWILNEKFNCTSSTITQYYCASDESCQCRRSVLAKECQKVVSVLVLTMQEVVRALTVTQKIILTYFILVSLIKVFSTKIQYRKYISSHPFLVFKEGLQGVKNSMRGIVKVRVVFK